MSRTNGSDGAAGKLPPQDLEAERAVLGGCMLSPDSIDELQPMLAPEHFYAAPHRQLCEVIYSLRDRNKTVDPIALGRELEARNWLADVGGAPYLITCMESVPHAQHAKYYAGLVKDAWRRRIIIEQCAETLRGAYDAGQKTDEIVARHDTATQKLLETTVSSADVMSIGRIMETLLDRRVEEEEREARPALKTEYYALDELSGGMRGGNVIIVAARSSMGKTAFALDIVRNLTLGGHPVLMFSLEMGSLDIAERLLSAQSGVAGHRIRKQELTDADHREIAEADNVLHGLPLHVDDRGELNCAMIGAVARRMKRSHDIELVVVDYLQLVTPDREHHNREREVSEISKRMKRLARNIDLPVLLLSQLSREVEKRERKRPRLSDLRESGAIEQDADQVWFIHRPDYYDPEDHPGQAEIIVSKNRNGPTSSPNQQVWLHWQADTMHFAEPAEPVPALFTKEF